MAFLRFVLLLVTLIAGMLITQIEARHHRHRHNGPQRSDDLVYPVQQPGGRGFQQNMDGSIPGFPMKGPVSVPFTYPEQQQQPPNMQYPGINGYQRPGNNYPFNLVPYVNNPNYPQRTNTNTQPRQFEQLQNYPSIEPVTNELPQPNEVETTNPTINPRELDLLYGSNLYEEEKKSAAQRVNQPTTLINFDDRMLIETAPHCKEGYKWMQGKCRLMV